MSYTLSRRAPASWQAFRPRGETVIRADLQDLEKRLARKAEKEATDAAVATKVRWCGYGVCVAIPSINSGHKFPAFGIRVHVSRDSTAQRSTQEEP